MPDPNKDNPKKEEAARATGNQPDTSKTMKPDEKNQPKEYTEGGGFGKQEGHRDVGQSVKGKTDEPTRKEVMPNQQNPEKKQDKEPMKADSEKSGVK